MLWQQWSKESRCKTGHLVIKVHQMSFKIWFFFVFRVIAAIAYPKMTQYTLIWQMEVQKLCKDPNCNLVGTCIIRDWILLEFLRLNLTGPPCTIREIYNFLTFSPTKGKENNVLLLFLKWGSDWSKNHKNTFKSLLPLHTYSYIKCITVEIGSLWASKTYVNKTEHAVQSYVARQGVSCQIRGYTKQICMR